MDTCSVQFVCMPCLISEWMHQMYSMSIYMHTSMLNLHMTTRTQIHTANANVLEFKKSGAHPTARLGLLSGCRVPDSGCRCVCREREKRRRCQQLLRQQRCREIAPTLGEIFQNGGTLDMNNHDGSFRLCIVNLHHDYE